MRHQWLLLGACGWVLLVLMFFSKFISLKTVEDYRKTPGQSWAEGDAKVVKPVSVQSPVKQTETPSQQPSGVPTVAEWQAVSEKRIEHLSAVCKNSSLRNLTRVSISKFVLDRIFVCDKRKILFCQTPKVGNTQWKKVLIVLNGAFPSVEEIPENLVHDHDKNGLPRLSSFSPQEITERLSSYFKFFIVRDPFERLISAFKDKFVKNPRFEPWYKHDIAPAIIYIYIYLKLS
ncbi:carbohydrate sulfotransferase 10-like [Fundulus diaphanus]